MTGDRSTTLFVEIFSDDLPRHGPGDTASTLKALDLVPRLGPAARLLDVGCGTGAQTLVLAQHTAANIVAIDNCPPSVDELSRRADALGIVDRIDVRVADMRQLDLAPGSFDLIWSEGAIYVMGFAAGLRAWRQLLAPTGYVAVTEVCWTRPDPPQECAAFWAEAYPSIREVPALLQVIDECGYETVGHFTLPPSSWWDDYYGPLQKNISSFRDRHPGDPDADALAAQVQREIDVWHKYADAYSYAFFVMRAR